MADLASASDWITLQSVAERMRLSQGYLEEVANALKQADLVEGRKGPGGGYRLAKPASDITIEAILVALEGPVTMVECQSTDKGCPVADHCSSKSLWDFLHRDVLQTLKRTTLADV